MCVCSQLMCVSLCGECVSEREREAIPLPSSRVVEVEKGTEIFSRGKNSVGYDKS